MPDDIKYIVSETMQFQLRYVLKQMPCNTGNINIKLNAKYNFCKLPTIRLATCKNCTLYHFLACLHIFM